MDAETPRTFEDLAQVVEHELFPDVDLALRRGRHVDREDGAWYGFLTDAQAHLERFYRRYGAELVQRTDGFFFLLPSGDKLGRRHLSPSEMLVGQGLTLLYLEPATVEQGGITTREQLLSQLSATMGTEQLMLAFNAKKKKLDERVAQEMVRARVSEGVRRLASLGFVDLLPEDRIRLRSSLMRFAEPVRGSGAELEALNRLVASGEISLTEDESDSEDSGDEVEPRVARRGPQAMPVTEWNEGSEWGSSFESETNEDSPPPEYVAAETSEDAEPAVADEPVEVADEPVEVPDEPVEVADEPVEVPNEPVEVADEPVEVAAEPVEPVAEPVEPVAEPVEPVAEPVEPAAEPPVVVAPEAAPVIEPLPGDEEEWSYGNDEEDEEELP